MSLQNIAEVTHVEGIESLLKNSPTRFIILACTLKSTPNDTKIYIRKWLKTTSKKFSNILFLYFCASTKDLGKMSLLPDDVNGYPFIYHIVDVKNILVKVNNANSETIRDSFDQVKEYYIKDMEDSLVKGNNEDEEISDNECDDANEGIKSNKEDNTEDNTEDIKENIKGSEELKNDNMAKLILKQREMLQNSQTEQKKLVEKVEILNTSAEKFRKKFLKDIKKRKLDEE